MKRCPQCGKTIKHYSTRRVYENFTKRYYKCLCGTTFITSYQVVETVIKVCRRGRNDISDC